MLPLLFVSFRLSAASKTGLRERNDAAKKGVFRSFYIDSILYHIGYDILIEQGVDISILAQSVASTEPALSNVEGLGMMKVECHS